MVSKKRIYNSCEDGIEKSVPRDHQLSSLGKPHDANQWSSGWIFHPTLTITINSNILSHQIAISVVTHAKYFYLAHPYQP